MFGWGWSSYFPESNKDALLRRLNISLRVQASAVLDDIAEKPFKSNGKYLHYYAHVQGFIPEDISVIKNLVPGIDTAKYNNVVAFDDQFEMIGLLCALTF